MPDRIDHAAEARELIEVERKPSPAGWETADAQHLANLMEAQALATLALVDAQREANEQARIGNLIALMDSPRTCTNVARAAERALMEGEPVVDRVLRPDIAAALGIEEVQS